MFLKFCSIIQHTVQLRWKSKKELARNYLSLPVEACPIATTLFNYIFIGGRATSAANTELMESSKRRIERLDSSSQNLHLFNSYIR